MNKKENFTKKIQQDLTLKVIDLMENKNLMNTKWNMETFGLASGLHYNHDSDHVFTGGNQLLCMFSGFSDNRWITSSTAFKKDNDYKVKKGSKVTYLLQPRIVKNDVEKVIEGKKITEERTWNYFVPVAYFNLEQIENAPEKEKIELQEFQVIKQAENFKNKMIKNDLDLRFTNESRYFYSPSGDFISMLRPEGFKENTSFYSVLFHEVGHWTGHKSRLDRIQNGKSHKQDYAFEELIAELFAVFQCASLGLEKLPRPDHARYLKSWIKNLKDNYSYLWKASSQAFKIVNYCDQLPNYI